MTDERPEVVYVLPDKLGGVFNYVKNLLEYRSADGWRYASLVTDNLRHPDTRSDEPLPGDRAERVHFELPPENIHTVLRRVARVIPKGPGVIVANDWIELALASQYDTGRAIVAVAHGDFDYYYDLAARHDASIDAFVTYTECIADGLRNRLPHRRESIHLLRYGVPIPPRARTPVPGPLRLLYVGRLHRDKGIFDLPQIDAQLRARGVEASWTVQGAGPDGEQLRQAWSSSRHVTFNGRLPMPEVLRLYEQHDVVVMPSRFEGLPVALLETGAAGVVPVVSDLSSGIPEVVTPGVTGYRPAPGDIGGFVEAVMSLDADRARLEAMSVAIRDLVTRRYEAGRCAAEYQRLYHDVVRLRRPYRRQRLPYGSRLDQPWIPNGVVRALRAATSRRSSPASR